MIVDTYHLKSVYYQKEKMNNKQRMFLWAIGLFSIGLLFGYVNHNKPYLIPFNILTLIIGMIIGMSRRKIKKWT